MANTITLTGSQGYSNVFSDLGWARSAPFHGYGRYATQNSGAWNVIADGANARGIIIKAGRGFGDGIYDETTADIALQFDPPPVGQTVYGAVLATRDWGAKTTTLRVLLGTTSTAQPPGGLTTNAGFTSDQVIALVQVVSGQTAVGPILDRRTWVEGARVYGFTRVGDTNLAGGSTTSGLVGFTQVPLRRGEYLIAATATVAAFVGSGNVDCALTFAATGGIDLVGQQVTLTGAAQTLVNVAKPYLHPGGLMDANLNLFTTSAWIGGVVRSGAFISASYIGPYYP